MRVFILFASMLLLNAHPACAQWKINDFEKGKEISPEVMSALKATTTIFFYRPSDEPRKADWEKALKAAWKVTPIELQPYSALASYAAAMEKPSGYSFLTMDDAMDEYNLRTTFLQLRLPWTEKQSIYGKRTMWKELVRIPLDNSMETLAMSGGIPEEYLYSTAEVRNWQPYIIANLLRPVSKLLIEGTEENWIVPHRDEERLRKAYRDSMYVTDYSLEVWVNKMGRMELEKPKKAPLSFCTKRMQPVTPEALDALLADPDQPLFHYVISARYGTRKLLWMQNSKDGEAVYLGSNNIGFTVELFEDMCNIAKGN